MDQNTPPTIRIARIGTFTSNEGIAVSFGAAELEAAAAAYDPQADPAPLVVGHPRLDDPAYGWVSGLRLRRASVPASITSRAERGSGTTAMDMMDAALLEMREA